MKRSEVSRYSARSTAAAECSHVYFFQNGDERPWILNVTMLRPISEIDESDLEDL